MSGRDVLSVGLFLLVMVFQVTVVNRLPLPGAGAPDLVLLTVVGYALVRGSSAGAVAGFCAGLAGDVLPPAAHVLGQQALVLCLIGFLAGRVGESYPDAGLFTALACAAVGPLVAVAVGALLGDDRISQPMLTATLPQAALYNLLAVPPMVWVVTRVVRGPRRRGLQPVRHLARGRI
ncbi:MULTISPECIES: rod shape-determining protein MreD [Streptosporangium]|uniref:Rod shape-determining protein MreD n=1 Tax=Streptosporangium brasiliense TaxID=47480 RepID=A0ABT9RA78_9ACTN|nr:rod shape-determining protein MreD [Streptosporangium brasiliense]MDP9866163.1 rod shape-determining protein MreD [Streptosporangium brasiliense]